MPLRPALLPPPLDPALVDRLTELAERVVRAIAKSEPTRDLLAEFNAQAGTRLAQFDFHAASASTTETLRDFVERVLTRVPRVAVDDAEATELVRRLQESEGTARERWFWTALLTEALESPGLPDLIRFPNQRLAPDAVVGIARTATGTALARYLDPICRGYHVARALLRRLVERRALVLRKGASLDDLARGAAQFLGREHVSPKQVASLSAWLVEQPSVEELFADDEQLAQHLTRV